MISTVTVVYEKELDLLKTQAQSFDLYLRTPGDIIVISNTLDPLDIDLNWWGKHKHKVQLHTRESIGYKRLVSIDGRETQQICKLLAPLKASTDWSLWFDAKTFLVRDLYPKQLLKDNNKFITNLMPVIDKFSDGFKVCKEMLKFEEDDEYWMAPGGMPYPVNRNVLLRLQEYVKLTTGSDLVDWFEKYSQYPHFVTEMILYSQFARTVFDEYYSNERPRYKCANLADWQLRETQDFWDQLEDPEVLTASIKADAWYLMSGGQQKQWLRYLKTKGLQYDAQGR
jgi:hypothetical protein